MNVIFIELVSHYALHITVWHNYNDANYLFSLNFNGHLSGVQIRKSEDISLLMFDVRYKNELRIAKKYEYVKSPAHYISHLAY